MNGEQTDGDGVPESLEDEVSHILEEARMIVPGIQALLGFQLMVVYNEAFFRKLDGAHRYVHLVSLCLIALAMGLVITPAAYHRQAEPGRLTRTLARRASRLLEAALGALMAGVVLDVYLIALVISESTVVSAAIGVGLFAALAALWFAFPRIAKARRSPGASSGRAGFVRRGRPKKASA